MAKQIIGFLTKEFLEDKYNQIQTSLSYYEAEGMTEEYDKAELMQCKISGLLEEFD